MTGDVIHFPGTEPPPAPVTAVIETMAPPSPTTGMPLLLTRPSERRPAARLTWKKGFIAADGREHPPRWGLTGQPWVIAKAERIFMCTYSRTANAVSWPADQGNFEDLLMLQHRHSIAVEEGVARDAWEKQYEDLIRKWEMRLGLVPDGTPPVDAPAKYFRGTLLPFQMEALRFMLGARKALLADEMGLGKTPVSLAWLDCIDEWPAAVVCQPHVVTHWGRKIEEFLDCVQLRAGELPPQRGLTWAYLKGEPKRETPRANIYLVHYLNLWQWSTFLTARGTRAVVFDEAQEMRVPHSRKYVACRDVSRSVRNVVGLSGTPIYNRGAEIYHVMNTIQRGCLGPMREFEDSWCEAGDKRIVSDPPLLGQHLVDRRLMLRRRKEDVLTELPEKRRVLEMIDADNAVFVDLVKEARKLAKVAFLCADPFDKARMEAEAINGARRATALAKVPAMIPFLVGLQEAGEPTLVFAHHHLVFDAIATGLVDYNPVEITGRESIPQKAASQDAFVAGATNVCMIGLRAATGLDGLQARARVVVFCELDWSPAVHKQAEDRAHRMGQRDSVLCYYLVCSIGSDPVLLQGLNLKETQFRGMMQDREETEDERKAAAEATLAHKEKLLAQLRDMAI